MRMIRRGRMFCLGGRRWLAVVVAALAACGVAGAVPSAALAGSTSVPTWTRQAPAIHPTARWNASMAYDAATGTAVLFGGASPTGHFLGDTWTWNGTTWTRQAPATHPSARDGAAMAYDAATGTVVLFGGSVGGGQTWTWDGTTWTRQAPATSPPNRTAASMAYDAATGTAVLFGGVNLAGHSLSDTWTWDGTTWTKQAPATHPGARNIAAMAYDTATGTAVLFGGANDTTAGPHDFGDTWTWDGTTWTKQAPATSPPALRGASMAYDAATGTAVLFGGAEDTAGFLLFGDTWTWDGTTWTKQAPATSPSARFVASMAYDAATGTAVLFGGEGHRGFPRDTWTWG